MRVGHGFDLHRLVEKGSGEERLVLGGVVVEAPFFLEAHSDGDVVLHAVCDALLGAVGLGDIGRHFPDSDEAFAGADSRGLLKHVVDLVQEKGFGVVNVDVSILAQVPKLAPFIGQMCGCIAEDLGVDVGQVNVKATTTEGLGVIGEKKAIAAHAVVLVEEGS